MKIFIKSLLLAVGLLISTKAFAAEIKIATVDMLAAQTNLLAMEDINRKLQKIQETIQNDLTTKEKQIRDRANELNEKRSVLTASALREQEMNIEKDLYTLQQDVQVQNGLMEKVRFQSITEVDEKMKDVVAKVAKKTGYNMVLSSNLFLYAENGVFGDLTADTVKMMNDEIKSVDVDGHYNKSKKEANGGAGAKQGTAKTKSAPKKKK